MSGSEFISEIVKARPGIPIILCTGYSSKISEENAKDKGISKFIIKPYSKKVLSESIREVLMAKVSKSATY
jgi:CheY-like chemotaxis protein